MKRADLEKLKAEMSTRYAEQLLSEQTHLTIDQRAHMCIGFEHGMGWLWKILEKAGLSLEEEAGPRGMVCLACRQVSPMGEWAAQYRPSVGVNARRAILDYQCPHCKAWQEAPL